MPDSLQQSMTLLDWMEQSGLGEWVAASPYGYYIMLGIHSVTLATLVGAVTIIDLRLLNAVRGISTAAMANMVKFVWWGLAINFFSGVALFFSEANKAFYSTAFRWKIAIIVCGAISTIILNRTVLVPAVAKPGFEQSGNAKMQAVISLLLWYSVITVGRMMAYLNETP